MKTITKIGLYGLVGGMTAFMAGCGTEKITVDYVMPAKAVADISKVNVAAIKVKANVTGGLAGDNKQNAGLVKQLLAMRLYKEGFYQIADDLWSNPDGALELEGMIKEKDAGHGRLASSLIPSRWRRTGSTRSRPFPTSRLRPRRAKSRPVNPISRLCRFRRSSSR